MQRTVRGLVILSWILLSGLAVAGAQPSGPAAWVELGSINVEHGLSVRNSADGQNEAAIVAGTKCRINNVRSEPPSFCFYFDYDAAAGRLRRPIYVTVDYFDQGFGTLWIQYDSADVTAPERGAYKDSAPELLLDSRKWRKVTFELRDARFDGRQNLGADFRLVCGGGVAISRVCIEMGYSGHFESQARSWKDRVAESAGRLAPMKHVQVVFGGIEAAYASDLPAALDQMRLLAPVLKTLGATSVESYVKWSLIEPKRGVSDWRYYDRLVAILRENGLKWNPYIMIGPAYATPEWFSQSEDSVFAACLEHGQPSRIQSIWNPNLPGWIDSFLGRFALRYRGSKMIESILIGISGDSGEAIYPVTGGGWESVVGGEYHTHAGYWCGDQYARADFRRYLESQYGSAAALNAAWKTDYADLDAIEPFVPDAAVSPRARLDLIKWYRGRMTKWADYWLRTARAHFPTTDIYLCTGGAGHPAHGADFAAQAKAAASYHAGIRIANEASDYALNFADTRLVATASRQYGAYYTFESPGTVTTTGITARVYNASTSGARGIHVYYPAVLAQPGGVAAWSDSYRWLGTSPPRPAVAVLFPQTSLALKWGGFYEKLMLLRDAFDFDVIDESMIRDGALTRYRALVIPECKVIESKDAARIREWVESGGIVIGCEASRFTTVEGDASVSLELFDVSQDHSPVVKDWGRGLAVFVAEDWDQGSRAAEAIARLLDTMSTRTRRNLVPDGRLDGVYVTDLGGRFLIFNSTGTDIEKELRVGIGQRRKVNLPAGKISEVKE